MEKRLIAVFSLFTLLSFLLFFRVGSLSFAEELALAAQNQSTYSLTLETTRGKIYDCRMLPLAGGETRKVAACLPMPENERVLLSNRTLQPIAGSVQGAIESGRPFLMNYTGAEETLDAPGITLFSLEDRSANQLAQHVVGYLDQSGKGITGIEKAYNDYLTQDAGESTISYRVDGLRSPFLGAQPSISLAPVQTKGVVLTIDSRIQQVVEEVGGRMLDRGAIVVMEPSTGKIRALASFPAYDPANLAKAVADEENAPLLNRAFCAYNVGSTFKIVTEAAALTQGVSFSEEYVCKGYTQVKDQVFRCHYLAGHGALTLEEALGVSCNPYFIELGLELSRRETVRTAENFSFGQASVFAPGFAAAKGYLPQEEELLYPAAMGNFSFGQGTLMATPVQIAQMVSSVVNGGMTPAASLVEGLTSDGKLIDQRESPLASVRAMNQWVAEKLRRDLVACVMEYENQNAKPQYVTAGGKTGTAQTGQYKENEEELLQGWFAGFFPAEEPQYTVVVLAEDARSGNQDASPVFREIADQLNAPKVLSE